MKSLFKVTLLATTMAVVLNAPAFAAPDAAKAPAARANSKTAFKNDDQKTAYALGASLGRYMENSLGEQQKLGIALDKAQLIAGVQDAFANKSKLSDEEIEQTLQTFDARVKAVAQAKMDKDAKENKEKGNAFRDAFAKEKGVKTSPTGLLYKVEKEGTGDAPKDTDTVVVNYIGNLVDGKEFDSSYKRGEPLSFRLDGVIPGWTEGLKNIKKGGKIKLVMPPELAYGEAGVPGIPANSTLVFEVELLDIKQAKTDAKPAAEADAKAAEAGAKAADVDAKAAEAGAKAADVDAKVAEAGAKAAEVETKAADAGAKAAEVETKAAEAGAKAAEVETKAAEAGAKAADAVKGN